MPGYAYPVGAETVAAGDSLSLNHLVDDTAISTASPFFTATSKTKVVTVTAVNVDIGIVPVRLYVKRGSNAPSIVARTRVLKLKALVLPIVSGDSRVGDSGPSDQDYNKIATEFVLQTGDKLYAVSRLANAVELTVELKENID